MSVQSRAPARSRPGAPPPRLRRDQFLALAASAAAALGLVLTVGPAASAATHTAAPAAPLHTYHVAPNGTDTSGSCTANTVHNAFPTIADALACAVSGDAISLAPTGTTPYQGFGTVSQNITIAAASGANARTVTVDATISSNLTVAAGATVTVSGVTIDGSNDVQSANVTNDGVLTLTRDAITNNVINSGILTSGSSAANAYLTLNATTVSGNVGGGGGGIDVVNGTTLTADNSTIANNLAGSTVGGIDLNPGTSATFVNSTITGNQDSPIGGLQVWPGASATLSNTIIARNSGDTAPDCHGTLTNGPGGHNLIGNATICTGLANGVNGDQVGVTTPGLVPLASNGGPTDTAALATGSPAIGGGDAATCEQAPVVNKDQRGDSRNATTRGVCDIGAYDTGGA